MRPKNTYTFTAKSPEYAGRVSGHVDADSPAEALKTLESEGLADIRDVLCVRFNGHWD